MFPQRNEGDFGPHWIAVNLVGLFIGIFLAEISSLAEPHRQSLVLTYGDVLSSQSGYHQPHILEHKFENEDGAAYLSTFPTELFTYHIYLCVSI